MLRLWLYRLYYVLVAAPLFIVATIVLSIVTILGCSVGAGRVFGYWPGRLWSQIGLVLMLHPVHIRGKENIPPRRSPCVVMANHQSGLDILMMYGYLGIPFKWVMKQSLRRVPFMGMACRMAGFIFVGGQDPASVKRTMEQAHQVLRERNAIFIFPEGHRTPTGEMQRFKKGGFVMAYQLGVPILPVTIKGAYEAMPKGKYIIRPSRLELVIHPAVHIDAEQPMPIAVKDSMRRVENAISSAL